MRAALGAPHLRIIRQLLTESLVLAIFGGGLGVLLALWGVPSVVAMVPAGLPYSNLIRVDPGTILMALAVATFMGIVFGLVPAVYSSRGDLARGIRDGGLQSSVARQGRCARSALIVSQIALAMIVLAGAGLMVRTYCDLLRIDLGYDPHNVANIEKIRRAADDYISRLEHAGIENFFCVRDGERPGVQDICRDLRIMSGSVISSEGPPTIFIAFPVGGGAVGPSIAIRACEKEAWKRDNRKKLGAAKSAERHLVVYIDATDGLPWIALTDFEPPSTSPNLPEEITCVWLIAHGNEEDEFVVWHASRNECWNVLRVVC